MKTLLVCLFLAGCAHKPKTLPIAAIEPPVIEDRPGCIVDDHTIRYWIGSDGMMAFGLTCENAFQDWRHTLPTPEMWKI